MVVPTSLALGFWNTLKVIVNPQCPNNPHSHPKYPHAVLFSSNFRGEPSQNINHKHSSIWALGLNLYGPQAHMGIAQVGRWMPSLDISKSCGWTQMKFCGQVRCLTRKKLFNFDEDPDPDVII